VGCHRAERLTTSASPTPTPTSTAAVGTFEQRLAVARSVKVETSILGLEIGDDLDKAHERLDPLGEPITPPKDEDEHDEREAKIFWQLRETDYRGVLVKTDDENRVTSIAGYLREEKLKPFESIGDIQVAPVHNDNQVAWDVVRPNRPQLRVAATGTEGKAAVITIFAVKREGKHN
jgi:hypothetical protein